MAVSNLATFICLAQSAVAAAQAGTWNSQKYMPQSYMPSDKTYGGHYETYVKPSNMAGSYRANFQRYTNEDALDYTQHVAMHQPKASGDEPSSLLAGQFFAGAQHGAEYNQYAGNYAKGYDKFMGQGKGNSQAMADYQKYQNGYSKGQAGDYQNFMKQFTGDDSDLQTYVGDYGQYHKYVSQAGASNAQAGDHQKYVQLFAADHTQKHAGGNAQYQEYMDKFAQDYNKFSSQANDYNKFLHDYAASFQHSINDKANDYSKYSDQFAHDYNKYSSQVGDYSKYVQGYASSGKVGDLSKYMGEHATNHSKYMDKFANDYNKFSSQTGDYGKFVQDYATHVGNGKVGDYSKLMEQYTGDSKMMGQFAQDYNKYSSQADDYRKFLQDYATSFQHDVNDKASDYAKYSDQFTGDLSNVMDRYMGQFGKPEEHSGKSASSQGGDFEKYMDKYARDNKKQQHQASKEGSDEGASDARKEHKRSEDEHKSSGKHPSVAAAQFFAVPHGAGAYHPQASKYMDMYSWGESAPGASYQKEYSARPDEASYWNHRQSFAGLEASRGPSPVAAVDFLAAQPAAAQGTAHQPHEGSALDQQNQHDFMKKFAGSWAPSHSGVSQQDFKQQYASKYMSGFTPEVSNYSDQHAWKESFKQQYFQQYAHYEQARKALQAKFPHVPNSVSECKNVSQVKEWEAAETASIEAYVPKEYHAHAIAAVKKAANDGVKELRAKEATASNSSSTKSSAEHALGKGGASTHSASQDVAASAAQFFAAQPSLSHEQYMANDAKVVAYKKAMQDYAAEHRADVNIGEDHQHHFMQKFAGSWAPAQPGASQQDFKEQYASKYMSGFTPEVSNYSDQHAWKKSFKQQYFQQHARYEQARKALQSKFPHVPNSVSECKNVSQVKEWEAAETASIDAYVPEEYHAHAIAAVKKSATDTAKELLAKSAVESSSSSRSGKDSSNAKQEGHAVKAASEGSPSSTRAKTSPDASAAQFFAAHPTASYEQVAAHSKAEQGSDVADAKAEDEQKQHFMKEFAGSWAPAQSGASQDAFKAQYASEYMSGVAPGVSNYSDQHAWKESFKQQYFAQYAKYEDSRKAVQAKFPHVPNSVSECQNASQVKEWAAAETASIDVFVPKEYREQATAAVNKAASDRITELKTAATARSTGGSSSNGGKSKSEDSTSKEADPDTKKVAAGGKTQASTGEQSDHELPSAAKPASAASVKSGGNKELAGKAKEFLQVRAATDGAAKPASASEEPASTSTRTSSLALSSVLAHGGPGAASLPAVAGLLAVVAFAGVAAVVAKRRQLLKPSGKTGLASPLLEA